MNTVTEIVEQTSIVRPYTSDINEPCDNGDWAYGEKRDCGPNCIKFECSELDPSTCPKIGKNIIVDWNFNDQGISESPQVSCMYSPSTFDFEDVLQYIDEFGKDTQYNEVVMPQFCFSTSDMSTNCEIDPITGNPWPECVNMIDRKDPGILCREWRSNNPELADTAQCRYCTNNSSDPTCGCYNRNKNPVYQIVSTDNPINDGCWYLPCSTPESYLVPSSLINDDPPCPDDDIVCGTVNKIISNSISSIPQSVFQEFITCDITATPKIPPINNGSKSFFWIFIIFIIIFIIIILFIVFYYYNSKSKKVKVSPIYNTEYINPNIGMSYIIKT
uniref:Entry-fusion-complex G9/A16 n=1 Tax=Pithovirus LCPAC102 TaxID=2506587 RepID=A0A481Z5E5_9VIRU|nr:MAG: entry-fusion-complex G9/A16 [Pithovirus LCPAC102]